MVEHWLPKPRVAGSNPVCRSNYILHLPGIFPTFSYVLYMAAIIILCVFVGGLVFMASECVNRMNKAAVAMFMGVVCWLVYIMYGTHFVVAEHPIDFLSYVSSAGVDADTVKTFIAQNLFFKYVLTAAEVILFLLATMTIVEVLGNNGCFDFIGGWLRTRSPKRFMWTVAGITFLLSANLDNVTTVCLMLGIMHTIIADDRGRMVFGSVIVVSAAAGGAFTVIGDVTTLTLWTNGKVTPSAYTAMVALPCLAALATTLWLIMRSLPSRLSLMQTAMPYRGDDTVLSPLWRLVLLFVGIGGLWFIPTFHNLTGLPTFVGALCVLSLLWIVNEICNRSLMHSDMMVRQRKPMALQYVNIQNMLLFMGLMLTFGVLKETGLPARFFSRIAADLDNVYLVGAVMGGLSAVFGNIPTLLGGVFFFNPEAGGAAQADVMVNYASGGVFWPLLSYSTALGSVVFSVSTVAGMALMRMEGVKMGWYFRHISGKVLVGWCVGLVVMWITTAFF